MKNRFTLRWKITEQHHEQLVRDFLKEKDISKVALTKIKYHGGKILVNDEEVTVRYLLTNGDVLTVHFPEETRSNGMIAEHIPINIIYEDDYLIVLNKCANQNTIPSREHPTGSVANALLGYYEQNNIQATVHIVTRLDRDTTGLILVAKYRYVHHLFSKQQRNGQIDRIYEALIEGTINEDEGVIEQPIRRKETSIIEREVHPTGQYACTYFSVLKRYDTFTHVQLKLETGRTHQIRVHLAYIGHPLLGDYLYGSSPLRMERQALHCRSITFTHPMTDTIHRFEAPLPLDMKKWLVE